MSRRAALPGANELFRTTGSGLDTDTDPQVPSTEPDDQMARESASTAGAGATTVKRRLRRVRSASLEPSGRERHEEKITVYLSAEELMALEDARVLLYRDHGVKCDRGRIVREAIAVVMSDLETKGTSSVLVRRMTGD
ncbi:MAG: hypothetical protein WAN48_05420 [Actinomycetes bacterium]